VFLFVRSVQSNFCVDLTTLASTENNCVFSLAQNRTALQPNIFLTGMLIYRLQTKDFLRFPIKTTDKVNWKLTLVLCANYPVFENFSTFLREFYLNIRLLCPEIKMD
jgi:hypothetical protein